MWVMLPFSPRKVTPMPKLTEMQSKSAKPAETGSRLTDERGLFLYITPKGNKILRVRLRSLPSARATVEGNMQRKKTGDS